MRSPVAGSITSPNTARPAASSCFTRNIAQAISRASGPARRTTPIPPRPGAVAMATMVSSRFMHRVQNLQFQIVTLPAATSSERSVSVVIAFQPGKMVFNPLIDVIDFTMEGGHFQLGLQVHFVVQVGFQSVL